MDQLYDFLEIVNPKLGFMAMPLMVAFKVIVIFIIAGISVKVGRFFLRNVFINHRRLGKNIPSFKMNNKRVDTLKTISISIYTYLVYIFAIISALTYITRALHMETILAAAGIGTVALGFSAQNSIRDMLAGIYILFDDQYTVGEYVTIDTLFGKVEDLELRVTKVRSDNGDLYIFANGDIRKVINHTRGNKTVDVDIPVAHSTDYKIVLKIGTEVCEIISKEFENLIEPARVLGVSQISTDGSYNVKIIAKTPANKHWDVERRIRELFNEKFFEEKIYFSDKNKIRIENTCKIKG